MIEPIFVEKRLDCNRRLRELNLDRGQLVDVVMQAVAARAGVTDYDPVSAPGYEFWRGGTRRLRELLVGHGWEKATINGIEYVIDISRKNRLSVVATDDNTASPNGLPKNRTLKGPATEEAVENNKQLILPLIFKDQKTIAPASEYTSWLLCIYDGGENVCAELSCPTEVLGGRFTHFNERIVILGPGEWNDIDPLQSTDDDFGPEIEINVQRK